MNPLYTKHTNLCAIVILFCLSVSAIKSTDDNKKNPSRLPTTTMEIIICCQLALFACRSSVYCVCVWLLAGDVRTVDGHTLYLQTHPTNMKCVLLLAAAKWIGCQPFHFIHAGAYPAIYHTHAHMPTIHTNTHWQRRRCPLTHATTPHYNGILWCNCDRANECCEWIFHLLFRTFYSNWSCDSGECVASQQQQQHRREACQPYKVICRNKRGRHNTRRHPWPLSESFGMCDVWCGVVLSQFCAVHSSVAMGNDENKQMIDDTCLSVCICICGCRFEMSALEWNWQIGYFDTVFFFSLRFVRVVCLWCVGGVCVCSGYGLGIFYFIFFGWKSTLYQLSSPNCYFRNEMQAKYIDRFIFFLFYIFLFAGRC